MNLLGGIPYVRNDLHPATIRLPHGFLIIEGIVVGGEAIFMGIFTIILAGLDMKIRSTAHQIKGLILGFLHHRLGGFVVDDAINLVIVALYAHFSGGEVTAQQAGELGVSQLIDIPARHFTGLLERDNITGFYKTVGSVFIQDGRSVYALRDRAGQNQVIAAHDRTFSRQPYPLQRLGMVCHLPHTKTVERRRVPLIGQKFRLPLPGFFSVHH